MYKLLKLLFINLAVILILIVSIDIIFGYWFDKNNFGPNMRGKRVQKIVFNHDNKKTYYLRDFYGFREDGNINEKYDASKIKIVFTGGSTGEEMFLNYNETIVGQINLYLKYDGIDLKIYNASLAGKSLKGHVNEFSYWFKKIPNFKPDIIIYYFGINDRKILENRWHDYEADLNFFQNIMWNITQKSFFWEKIKRIKDKYFFSEENVSQYFTDDEDLLKKLSNNEFISYDYAEKNYDLKNEEEIKIIENFKLNLQNLKKQLDIWNIKPIFITQIKYDINGDKILFFLNKELRKFSINNNYKIVKLDELIKSPLNNSFVDDTHTNKDGSEKIAKILYPHLKTEMLKYLNNQ